MDKAEFDQRCDALRHRAHGRWTGLLLSLGVEDKLLNRKNQPCPLDGCGGTDRFQYTDKFGDGNYICRSCGAGGGFKFAMHYFGWNATATLLKLEGMLGIAELARQDAWAPPDVQKVIDRILAEARPIQPGDPVDRYLRGRGLGMPLYPRSLLCHPSLGYYESDGRTGKPKLVGRHAAMVACVQDRTDRIVALHRTYLVDGKKLTGMAAKKLLGFGVGAAIRLSDATDELSTCEGVETGLAILKRTGQPVWPGICASNLESLWIPDAVRHLRVYGDNDADCMFDGQASSYVLARSFMKSPRHGKERRAEVFIPRVAGEDWASVLERQSFPEQHAA